MSKDLYTGKPAIKNLLSKRFFIVNALIPFGGIILFLTYQHFFQINWTSNEIDAFNCFLVPVSMLLLRAGFPSQPAIKNIEGLKNQVSYRLSQIIYVPGLLFLAAFEIVSSYILKSDAVVPWAAVLFITFSLLCFVQ